MSPVFSQNTYHSSPRCAVPALPGIGVTVLEKAPGLHAEPLALLLGWTEATFLQRTEGSAIRRIGHRRWLRNLAVAAGNALRLPHALTQAERETLRTALAAWSQHPDGVVAEHIHWALAAPAGAA